VSFFFPTTAAPLLLSFFFFFLSPCHVKQALASQPSFFFSVFPALVLPPTARFSWCDVTPPRNDFLSRPPNPRRSRLTFFSRTFWLFLLNFLRFFFFFFLFGRFERLTLFLSSVRHWSSGHTQPPFPFPFFLPICPAAPHFYVPALRPTIRFLQF